MADILSEAQIGEIQKCFSAVDTDADGIVRTSDLGKLMRLLGQNPTDSELQVSFLFLPMIFWQIKYSGNQKFMSTYLIEISSTRSFLSVRPITQLYFLQ